MSCRQRRGRSQEVSGVQWCLPVGARPRARPAGASWTRQSEVTCMLRGKRESFPVRKTPSPCPVGQKQPRNHTESWGVSRPLLSHAVDTPGVSRECQGTHPRSGVGARRPRLAIQTRSTSPSLLITRGLQGREQPPLSVQQLFQSPFYVHPVSDSSHPEIYEVLLLKVW